MMCTTAVHVRKIEYRPDLSSNEIFPFCFRFIQNGKDR